MSTLANLKLCLQRWVDRFCKDRADNVKASTAYLNEVLKDVGKDDDKAMLERLPVSPYVLSIS